MLLAPSFFWQMFVSDPSEQIIAQERFLFSWRLLLIDAILLIYLLLVTFIALLLGIDATTNVVGCALFKYAIILIKVDNSDLHGIERTDHNSTARAIMTAC